MQSLFNPSFFINNRRALKELCQKCSLIIVGANTLVQRNNDSSYFFSQDRNFWYLTGINEPDAILVIDNDEEYLIMPNKSHYQVIFDGINSPDQLSRTSGIVKVLDYSDGFILINQKIKKYGSLGIINKTDKYLETFGFWTNPGPSNLVEKIKNNNSKVELVDISQYLITLRQIKQPVEIKAIKKAIAITEEAVMYVKNKLYDYKFEYQIEADIDHFFKFNYNVEHAFDPIIASGKNACVLHNRENSGVLRKSNLVTIDIGAEYQNYAADITRTYSLSNSSSKFQEKIFEAVKKVHTQAMNILKPGVFLKDCEQQIESLIGDELLALNLIKNKSISEIRKIYPHSSSHFLGLEVHDVGHYNEPLKPGMILTVEPGIYLQNKSIGVRIEDDILITKKGNILLSSLPRILN